MRPGDIIRIPGDEHFYRVDFVNYARAYIVPLARQPRTIHTAKGDVVIHPTTDGAGFNISPGSPVEVVPIQELPADLHRRLRAKEAA